MTAKTPASEDELTAFIRSLPPPKWYAPYWPFRLDKELRVLAITFFRGSICVHPVTKTHLFDLLKDAHTNRFVGVQIWY